MIDEEKTARKFCDDNEFVVGTPILQVYYNGKSVRYRFLRREDVNSRPTNVYIGQLHMTTIQTLVNFTFNAINKQSDTNDGIIVDVDMDALAGIVRNEDYESEEEEEEEDSETDTGEDTTEEEEESHNEDTVSD